MALRGRACREGSGPVGISCMDACQHLEDCQFLTITTRFCLYTKSQIQRLRCIIIQMNSDKVVPEIGRERNEF